MVNVKKIDGHFLKYDKILLYQKKPCATFVAHGIFIANILIFSVNNYSPIVQPLVQSPSENAPRTGLRSKNASVFACVVVRKEEVTVGMRPFASNKPAAVVKTEFSGCPLKKPLSVNGAPASSSNALLQANVTPEIVVAPAGVVAARYVGN